MPSARQSVHLVQEVLVGMRRVAKTAELTYVPSGTLSSVQVTVLEVRSETGKWSYCFG